MQDKVPFDECFNAVAPCCMWANRAHFLKCSREGCKDEARGVGLGWGGVGWGGPRVLLGLWCSHNSPLWQEINSLLLSCHLTAARSCNTQLNQLMVSFKTVIIPLWLQAAGWMLKLCVGEHPRLILSEFPLTYRPESPRVSTSSHPALCPHCRSLLYRDFVCFSIFIISSDHLLFFPSLCSFMWLFICVQFPLLSCCSMQILLP